MLFPAFGVLLTLALSLGANAAAANVPVESLGSHTPQETSTASPTAHAPDGAAHELQRADLDAQLRMADASERMVELTDQQLWVGIANAALLLVTVFLSAWAARSASRAAAAAREVLSTERAWVTSEGVKCAMGSGSITINGVPRHKALMFHATWVNSGRTPALNLRLVMRHRTIPSDADIPTFDAIPEDDAGDSSAVLGPGQRFLTSYSAIAGKELEELLNGTSKLVVYSNARYLDIFDSHKVRDSQTCQVVVINGIISDGKGGEKVNHEIRAIGTQNTAT